MSESFLMTLLWICCRMWKRCLTQPSKWFFSLRGERRSQEGRRNTEDPVAPLRKCFKDCIFFFLLLCEEVAVKKSLQTRFTCQKSAGISSVEAAWRLRTQHKSQQHCDSLWFLCLGWNCNLEDKGTFGSLICMWTVSFSVFGCVDLQIV